LDVPIKLCIFAGDYEKKRNEKNRNMENPFKFGTDGNVIYSDRYEIEDPFFKEWILKEML
jgi:hypothetical protein